MRFVTFEHQAAAERFGFVTASGNIADLEGAVTAQLASEIPEERAYELAAALAPPDSQAFIEGGETSLRAARKAESFVNAAEAGRNIPAGPRGEQIFFAARAVTLQAALPRPRKFIAAGKNFFAHQMEMQKRRDPVAPQVPIAHVQFASTVVGPDATIAYPKETKSLDYEVELAVVIGKRAFDVSIRDAYDYVFGYMIYNDISAREVYWGERSKGGGIGMLGKNLPGFSPLGAYLVTRDEIPNPKTLGLRSRVNGETRQDATIELMMFSIEEQISHWSKIGLEAGDVLGTGTPGGVAAGRDPKDPPWWLNPGDVVECEIDQLGTLRTYIA